MTVKKKYKDYETALQRLEEITELLESGEQSLEQAIELYEEGLEIAKFCNQKLSEAEKKIKIITKENNIFLEDDFETQQE
ncbi:MAG: exodeoxyribonuclease VII small subunit [FCB group bacterium]|nr:exodeoxyribonuclease VII small subunit [FCB group bacterium]